MGAGRLLALACCLRGAAALQPLAARRRRQAGHAPRLRASPDGAAAAAEDGVPRGLRVAALVTVPVVWGTYAPAVRYVFQQPVPPPGVVFSAAYYVVALAVIASATAVRRRGDLGPAAASSSRAPDAAGAELGGYLFLGNCAQVVGLESTTADTAAFLVQLTTIFVPVLEGVLNPRDKVSGRTVRACLLAFAGVLVLFSDAFLEGAAGSLRGDALIVLAAVFYSLHVLRLGAIVQDVDPLELAVSKAKFETIFAVATVLGLLAFTPAEDVRRFLDAAPTLSAPDQTSLALAALWCGTLTCAYTIWAQSFGQRAIRPARANLVYTSQPIFSALFAALLLDERPTPAIFIGGACILTAIISEIGADEIAPPAKGS